jgi:hypothetical protein
VTKGEGSFDELLVEVAILVTEKCFQELLDEPAILVFKEVFKEEGASGVLVSRAILSGGSNYVGVTLLTLKGASGLLRKPLNKVFFIFDKERGSR